MACLERCCSRATSSSRFSRGMARTYLLILPRSYNINSFCDCAQLRTGSHRNNFRLRTRLRTPISSVAKYSLRVSIAPKKIIKAQWSSVGTVLKIANFGPPWSPSVKVVIFTDCKDIYNLTCNFIKAATLFFLCYTGRKEARTWGFLP